MERVVRYPVRYEARLPRQEIGGHRRDYRDIVRKSRLPGEIPPHGFHVLRVDLDECRVVVERSPWSYGRAPENAEPEVADLLAVESDRWARERGVVERHI